MQLPLSHIRILISGAGVAGPAQALCLARYGAQVTVVEVAPAPRTGGFAVDFRGPTHMRVLQELGVLEALRARRTQGSAMRAVDADGGEIFRLPAAFSGGELEVYRGDLSRVLYERSAAHAEYLFGERVVALRQQYDGVEVELAHAGTRRFDLVIGADGMHSAVRALAFGPEREYLKHLGYYIAGWSAPNTFGANDDSEQFARPGLMASITADQRDRSRAVALLVFASEATDIDWRDSARQKRLLAHTFAGQRWHVPQLLRTLPDADDLYFDAISRVQMPRWTRGRVALLGDAAWGVTLGGMGVGRGLIGAYVLAGELAAVSGDAQRAFASYEQRMRKYGAAWLKGTNAGKFLAPASARGLWLRNTLFSMRAMQTLLIRSTHSMATDAELPQYALGS
jgi:2-polyprenyl-6-methoxyphenol hydroxylase-like FAD-dependent oxidoreductase